MLPVQVSIVIPVWNKDELVRLLCRRAVASILNYVEAPYELILIDNASPCGVLVNDLVDLLEEIPSKEWSIRTMEKNIGFGPAVNIGLALAQGRYFCQMNTDVELVEDSVSMLIEILEKNHFDAVMPEHFENCMHYSMGKKDELMTESWRFGAFYLGLRDSFRKVCGYNERFRMCYWEDTDLWARMEKEGMRLCGWRGTWVSHWGGASAHPDRDRFFAENRALYASLHGLES